MRKIFTRLITKAIIKRMKKSGIKDETFQRLLVYYTLLSMINIDSDEVTITYEVEDYTLEMDVKLMKGGEK